MAHVPAPQRRAQLITAAIELLMREGPSAGSTRAIAAEIGVPQATVHYVFGTKEELYRAVIRQLTNDLVEYVRSVEIPAATDFEGSIAKLAERLWQTVIEQPGKHQLLSELSMLALRSPQFRDMFEEHRCTVDQATASLIEETAQHFEIEPAVDTLYLARYFLAAVDGLINQHLTSPDADSEAWCLDCVVRSTTALVNGRGVMAGISTPGRVVS
ncbi:TetR/AcrR family transcriptional regulator [Nocardia sp. NPDC050630]|uniref:TetR/AcrR family transcriptional regulator n=1 Tax=Nocardia sp. NPDC050630 TaxID=3364321 RepID=UPI0037BCBD26